MKMKLNKSLEHELGLGGEMTDFYNKPELSPFIDCSASTPNPNSHNHTNCEILKIEYKRPHSTVHSSITTIYLKCRVCGSNFTQYIV
jgi:hypothetical protein